VKPVAFDYVRAESREEVLDLLVETGDEAALLAGGMSLGPMLNFRAAMPGLVVDLNRVPDLDTVDIDGNVATGAMLRQAVAMKDAGLMAAVPLLNLALPWVGHMQTRSRGTFGGSVAHADPSAEIPLCLVTLGGAVELASKGGVREVPACDFFEGVLTTARREDEMISALAWPKAGPRQGFAFTEEAQRHGDFALTAAAAWVELDAAGAIAGGALGLGGVEDRPVARALGDWIGAAMDEATANDIAASLADTVDAMGDHVADARYRRHLARVLGARVLTQAAVEAGK
jgi:2-furoyl-CoA dehydrogenase FAD binding subunit